MGQEDNREWSQRKWIIFANEIKQHDWLWRLYEHGRHTESLAAHDITTAASQHLHAWYVGWVPQQILSGFARNRQYLGNERKPPCFAGWLSSRSSARQKMEARRWH